jgi:hypothetical protein
MHIPQPVGVAGKFRRGKELDGACCNAPLLFRFLFRRERGVEKAPLLELPVKQTNHRGNRVRNISRVTSSFAPPGWVPLKRADPGGAVRLYLLVEWGGGKSTRNLKIFRVAYHPGNPFWRACCPEFTT